MWFWSWFWCNSDLRSHKRSFAHSLRWDGGTWWGVLVKGSSQMPDFLVIDLPDFPWMWSCCVPPGNRVPVSLSLFLTFSHVLSRSLMLSHCLALTLCFSLSLGSGDNFKKSIFFPPWLFIEQPVWMGKMRISCLLYYSQSQAVCKRVAFSAAFSNHIQ